MGEESMPEKNKFQVVKHQSENVGQQHILVLYLFVSWFWHRMANLATCAARLYSYLVSLSFSDVKWHA